MDDQSSAPAPQINLNRCALIADQFDALGERGRGKFYLFRTTYNGACLVGDTAVLDDWNALAANAERALMLPPAFKWEGDPKEAHAALLGNGLRFAQVLVLSDTTTLDFDPFLECGPKGCPVVKNPFLAASLLIRSIIAEARGVADADDCDRAANRQREAGGTPKATDDKQLPPAVSAKQLANMLNASQGAVSTWLTRLSEKNPFVRLSLSESERGDTRGHLYWTDQVWALACAHFLKSP